MSRQAESDQPHAKRKLLQPSKEVAAKMAPETTSPLLSLFPVEGIQ